MSSSEPRHFFGDGPSELRAVTVVPGPGEPSTVAPILAGDTAANNAPGGGRSLVDIACEYFIACEYL